MGNQWILEILETAIWGVPRLDNACLQCSDLPRAGHQCKACNEKVNVLVRVGGTVYRNGRRHTHRTSSIDVAVAVDIDAMVSNGGGKPVTMPMSVSEHMFVGAGCGR
jgi:hypothetical protein